LEEELSTTRIHKKQAYHLALGIDKLGQAPPFFPVELSKEKNASWGKSTLPILFSLALPSFCLLRCFN
jgi:hypothetical protein